MNEVFSIEVEQKIHRCFDSMQFRCIYCDNRNPLPVSNVMCNNEILKFHPPGQPLSEDIEIKTALYVTAFLICPDCKNKYFVKILDHGKIK